MKLQYNDDSIFSDAELWEKIKLDSIHSFDILFKRYWSTVYSTSFIYLKDKESCLEITHDIFLNIWEKRHSLEIVAFANYLKAAARYHVYKAIRRTKQRREQYMGDGIELNPTIHDVNNGEEAIKYEEMQQEIERVLQMLPQRCREIFILSRFENLSNTEIAARFGISKRTVENQLTHALKILRITIKGTLYIFLLLNI